MISTYKNNNSIRSGELYLIKYSLGWVKHSQEIKTMLNDLSLLKNKIALYLMAKDHIYNILSKEDFYRAELWIVSYHFYIGDEDSKYFFDLLYDGYDEAMGGLSTRKKIIMDNLSTFPESYPKNCFGEKVPLNLSKVHDWINKITK